MRGHGLLLLALGLVLGGLAVWLSDWLAPARDEAALPVRLLERVDPGCDASRAVCTARAGDQALALRMQGPVVGLRPFRVQVVPAGMVVREARLDFTMPGMDMGQNRYRLLPEGNGWVGLVTLPLCTTGRRDWQVRVQLVGDGQAWEARFPFEMQGR